MVNVFAVVAFTVPLLNFEVQGRGQQNQEQDGNRLIGWAIDKLDTGSSFLAAGEWRRIIGLPVSDVSPFFTGVNYSK